MWRICGATGHHHSPAILTLFVLQFDNRDDCGFGALCMVGPSWSPCSRYVPYFDSARDLYVLNAKLETVLAVSSNHSTYHFKHHWQSGGGSVLHAWAPDGTLVASTEWGQVTFCWHPSKQHQGKQAMAAHLSAVLADLTSSDELHYFTWGACGGLAAVAAIWRQGHHGVRHTDAKLYVSVPGQPLVSMEVGYILHANLAWSPAGDRLLVDDRCQVHLVSSKCTPIKEFAGCTACFCPSGRLIAVLGGALGRKDDVALKVCRALDGSQVFSLTGSSLVRCMPRFSVHGDVLILAGAHDMRIMCFDWSTGPSTAYSQQVCSWVAAACKWVYGLQHGCCGWRC